MIIQLPTEISVVFNPPHVLLQPIMGIITYNSAIIENHEPYLSLLSFRFLNSDDYLLTAIITLLLGSRVFLIRSYQKIAVRSACL